MPGNPSRSGSKRGRLRCGFSTGTAAAAAAKAALRHLITGVCADAVAVRLPSGVYLAVPVAWSTTQGGTACASVIKDGGDDPDITNGAEIRATVSILRHGPEQAGRAECDSPAILLVAGKGVGLVTKPGLPVAPGEPAINPVPRQMLSENITLELMRSENSDFEPLFLNCSDMAVSASRGTRTDKPALHLPLYAKTGPVETFKRANNFSVMVEIEVPRGEELSRYTLNPRLGILGGISILGTTGLVKPFSNEAYEQTIQAAISVAASNDCGAMVLSTGGKSERFAMGLLPELPPEAFVQIADFFSFAVRKARLYGFSRIIHSIFFGKAIKMAQGHPYTHAHSVPLDLDFLAGIAHSLGHDAAHCRELASANTARHALEIIAAKGSYNVLESVAQRAALQSARLAGEGAGIRLFLFDYDGRLLADVK
ncbi:MAG TPA: cobalt-precorrin-5B (C(1))-methyltransferase [Deltaproteobacteria bacterium]|jgi:cobalt-precorrin-5B (C1)-methyltransferase|nr:cobalt-precorrin-5B (C(1))-methyltransferase [Deltaproteobacteria bacterium]